MDIRHSRLGGASEWLVALAFLAATVVVGALLVHEMWAVRTTPPSPAEQPLRGAPRATIPDGAIKVPSLLLSDGRQIKVGDTLERVASELGPSCQAGADVIEEGPLGNRITRSCDHAGTRFMIVFAPYERNGAPRVTEIYLR